MTTLWVAPFRRFISEAFEGRRYEAENQIDMLCWYEGSVFLARKKIERHEQKLSRLAKVTERIDATWRIAKSDLAFVRRQLRDHAEWLEDRNSGFAGAEQQDQAAQAQACREIAGLPAWVFENASQA